MSYTYNDIAVELFKTATGIGFYDNALHTILNSNLCNEEERSIIETWRQIESSREKNKNTIAYEYEEHAKQVLLNLAKKLTERQTLMDDAMLVEKVIKLNLRAGNIKLDEGDNGEFYEAFVRLIRVARRVSDIYGQ